MYPSFDPLTTLTPLVRPIQATSAKTLFLGGDGELVVIGTLHRKVWVAGQQCWVDVRIQNGSSKRVRHITFSVHRNTTTFRILPQYGPTGEKKRPDEVDINRCERDTSSTKVAESVLESGTKGGKQGVTGKGWWLGVDGKSESQFTYGVTIPVRPSHLRTTPTIDLNPA